MKTAREIAHEHAKGGDYRPEGFWCGAIDNPAEAHSTVCDKVTFAIRAGQLDALGWAVSMVLYGSGPVAQIRDRIAELVGECATRCKRCGLPKLDWQVYCGAACSALAEAGK